jgi:hypothetical protein
MKTFITIIPEIIMHVFTTLILFRNFIHYFLLNDPLGYSDMLDN